MPYSGASDTSLPAHVKKLPAKKRRQWVEVFNSVFARTGDEGKAMRQANGVVMNKALFFKDRGGKLWFVGIYSNNFEDSTGDIITKEAHEKYAQWIEKTGVRPPIIMMHMPRLPEPLGTAFYVAHLLGLASGKISAEDYNKNLLELHRKSAIAQTRTVIPMDGFMIVVGEVLDDKRDLVLKILKDKDRWGMSHGFIKVQSNGNIITDYHSFEFSVLPVEWAANGLTAINFRSKLMSDKEKELTPNQEDILEEVFEDTAEDMEATVKKAREILSGLLDSKGVGDYVEVRQKLQADFKLNELAQVLTQIGTELKAINARLDTLEKSDDEKIAEAFQLEWRIDMGEDVEDENPELLAQLKENVPAGVMPEPDMGNVMDITWTNLLGGGVK